MAKGFALTMCRLLAALVCLLSANELLPRAAAQPAFESSALLRAVPASDDSERASESPGPCDEREEREQDEQDDEQDDLDDSRHMPWARWAVHSVALGLQAFPGAPTCDAPRSIHLSLDPRPPRRA